MMIETIMVKNTVGKFVLKVLQDAEKLKKTQEKGFMGNCYMYVFIRNETEDMYNFISKKLSGRNEIKLISSNR